MDSVPRATDTAQSQAAPGNVPDLADGLRELASRLEILAGALGRMHPAQRRALISAAASLAADLEAIRLGVPEVNL